MLKWLKTTIEVYYVNLLKMNINKSLNLKFHRELTLNSLKIITFTIEKAILLIGFNVNLFVDLFNK
ncbi:hypothetical protein BANRA_01090 [Acinetobacter baumannii]|nr:hypothetical protein BANRA_00564 [Acinetobacter baumannii]VCX18551.1 hypothetical protein BANRA_02612 [Acinetobacter baumannii]VCX75102.1 hypothetical protein BANRA_01090 [Acinetobacter baumannii]VCZ52580.1 hypothetical protein BANRA_01065 [Acinetobacter baumannii]